MLQRVNSTRRVAFVCVSHPHAAGRLLAAKSIEGCEVAGLWDPDPGCAKSTAEQFGVPLFEDFSEAIRPDVDLVIIDGTNAQCSEFATLCAREGKAILVEKPGAESPARLEELAQTVHETGVFCQVGYHLRYSPSVRWALEQHQSGRIGRVTTGRFHAAVMSPWLTNEWFTDTRDRGGMVYLDFCHMLDLLMLFLGDLSAQKSVISALAGMPPHPFEDSAAMILQFGDVLLAGDVCGWEANDWITTWNIELYGTNGTLDVGIHPPIASLLVRDWDTGAESTHKHSTANFDGNLNYRYELEDALVSIESGKPRHGCSMDSALRVARAIEDMYRENGL
ncbi:MAG: hypothetical protein AKCLJLPJ_00646 [Fimbriimonadales bacterium]|nr:hypothetical protein [Fimbriimonadales bacterium]